MNLSESLITFFSTLYTFKRALVTLFMGASVIIFLSKLLPFIKNTIEPQLKNTLDNYNLYIIIFTIVLASAFGVVFFHIFKYIFKCLSNGFLMCIKFFSDRKLKNKKAEQSILSNAKIVSDFKTAQPYLSKQMIQIIRACLRNPTVCYASDNSDIRFLEEQNWLIADTAVNDYENVYHINHLLIDSANSFWDAEVQTHADRFLSYGSKVSGFFITLLSNETFKDANHSLEPFDFEFAEDIIKKCFDLNDLGSVYIVKFKERYQAYFEKKLDIKFIDSSTFFIK